MDLKLVECVPNFSEGKDQGIIDAISNAIRQTKGCSLIGVDPGASTNRTVYTFVGSPSDCILGAFNAAKVAKELIDMSKHKGEHPRLGAMDVCPFVPVRNSTMEDCAIAAKQLGEKLGLELDIPIYLYGNAAVQSYRKTVPQIRSGEYEGLAEKIIKDEWTPDYGPGKFNPKWGASMVGARKFLLAYNINILATKEQAHRIALNLREAGRSEKEPGKLKCVQGIGWFLEEANMAQISFNITDQDVTSLNQIFEESVIEAKALNLSVVGSELVGLVPESALLTAAEFYIKKENLMILDVDQKVRLAIDRLGLNSLYPFDPKERIIEWKVRASDPPRPLLDITATEFVQKVRERSSAPGGGSVAAYVGSLGASLGSMVGLLTYGKKQWESLDSKMRTLIPPLYQSVDKILPLVEEDTKAFELYVEAVRETKDDKSPKAQTALLNAINVPMQLAQELDALWDHLDEMSKVGNPNCLSDIQVGVKCVETGIFGARCNVLINCSTLVDPQLRSKLISEANKLWRDGEKRSALIIQRLESNYKE